MIPTKNAREIEKMRQACRTASDILDRVSDLIRPGITTKEVDDAAADFMSEARVKRAFLVYGLGHPCFPREHLHLTERRSGSRHRQPAAHSIWRYSETGYWHHSRRLGGRQRHDG